MREPVIKTKIHVPNILVNEGNHEDGEKTEDEEYDVDPFNFEDYSKALGTSPNSKKGSLASFNRKF